METAPHNGAEGPDPRNVKLVIYDLLGREVAVCKWERSPRCASWRWRAEGRSETRSRPLSGHSARI
jgi:hypothetical protein